MFFFVIRCSSSIKFKIIIRERKKKVVIFIRFIDYDDNDINKNKTV
jgi:hypothetical protein